MSHVSCESCDMTRRVTYDWGVWMRHTEAYDCDTHWVVWMSHTFTIFVRMWHTEAYECDTHSRLSRMNVTYWGVWLWPTLSRINVTHIHDWGVWMWHTEAYDCDPLRRMHVTHIHNWVVWIWHTQSSHHTYEWDVPHMWLGRATDMHQSPSHMWSRVVPHTYAPVRATDMHQSPVCGTMRLGRATDMHQSRVVPHTYAPVDMCSTHLGMGWLQLVGSLKLYVSFAKEHYKRDDILQKRPITLRSLLHLAIP